MQAWATIGGVRRARGAMPYSTHLLDFLINTMPEKSDFFIGMWLETLTEEQIRTLRAVSRDVEDITTQEACERQGDMFFLVELCLFEEKSGQISAPLTSVENYIDSVWCLAYCVCLEQLRRDGHIQTDRISLNGNNMRASITTRGRQMIGLLETDLNEALQVLDEHNSSIGYIH
jgi:hypothetical protein